MATTEFLRRCAFFAGTLTLSTLMLAQGGNPWDSEPTDIPEEAYDLAAPDSRNPKNRFGVHGGVSFGVKAKFISDAFSGNNIIAVPGGGLENVNVVGSRGSDKDRGALGGDLFYELVLGESDLLSEGVNEMWGVHIGLGYNEFGFGTSSNVDVFRDGDGAFLNTGQINHDLDADMWRIDVGLFKESYLTDRVYAKVGGGFSLAYIDADYTASGPFNFAPLSGSDSDFVFGAYVDLTVGYDITRNWSLYSGLRYQFLSDFEVDNGGGEAKMEFDQAYSAFIGLRYAF